MKSLKPTVNDLLMPLVVAICAVNLSLAIRTNPFDPDASPVIR